jgi:hypothetical protein
MLSVVINNNNLINILTYMVLVIRLYLQLSLALLIKGNDQYIGFVLNFVSFLDLPIVTYSSQVLEGPSWPWSYDSWIYNYICNQCLSPLMLWVRIAIRSMRTTLCGKVCRRLATGWWFRWVLRFPPQIKQTTTIYLKYCWKWRSASTSKHLLTFTLNVLSIVKSVIWL